MAKREEKVIDGRTYRVARPSKDPVVLSALADYPWKVEILEREGSLYTHSAGLLLFDPRLNPTSRARHFRPEEKLGRLVGLAKSICQLAPLALIVKLLGEGPLPQRPYGLVTLVVALLLQGAVFRRLGYRWWLALPLAGGWVCAVLVSFN